MGSTRRRISKTEHATKAGAGPEIVAKGDGLHLPCNSRLTRLTATELARARQAVFLDRDGVVIEDVHHLHRVTQLRVLPGAADALRRLQERFYLIMVTNQSAVARGFLTEMDLLDIHRELVRQLARRQVVLDAIYYCPHLPQATVAVYRMTCECRKPEPGMLRRAQADWGLDLGRCFLIGDMARDIDAARAAGLTGIFLGDPAAAGAGAHACVADLLQASRVIMRSVGIHRASMAR